MEDDQSASLDAEGAIKSIKLSLSTGKEICTYSINECPATHLSQLGNPFLGLPLESGKCESCGASENDKCEGHFGYIELPVPIYHPCHVSELRQLLSLICLKCLRIKQGKLKQNNGKGNVSSNSCYYCRDIPALSLKEIKTANRAVCLELRAPHKKHTTERLWNFLDKYGFHHGGCSQVRILLPEEAQNILKKVPDDTRRKLAARGYIVQSGWYMMKYLPVPLNCPYIPEFTDWRDGIMTNDSSIALLKAALRKIDQIKRSRSGSPNFESHDAESCDLQLAIGQYMRLKGTTRCIYSINEFPVTHPSQLGNPFLGLPLEAGKCESCGASANDNCEGHFGYIELPVPIYHPCHVSELRDLLSMICLKCLRLNKGKALGRRHWKGNISATCHYCRDIPALSLEEIKTADSPIRLELRTTHIQHMTERSWNFLDKYGFHHGGRSQVRALLPEEAQNILKKVPDDTRRMLTARGYIVQSGWYVMKYLPVPLSFQYIPEFTVGQSIMSRDTSIALLKKALQKIDQIKRSRSGSPDFESHDAESCDLQLAIGHYMRLRVTTRGIQAAACYETKTVNNWDAISTICSTDHANGDRAMTGAESAQDPPEQPSEASPDFPQKSQRTICSTDHASGDRAMTGAESAQDPPEQPSEASPDFPQKRQRTICSTDDTSGDRAMTGAESAQDPPEQPSEASPGFPQKRQRVEETILCMLEDMKTSFQDALKFTEPLPMPQVTPPAEILAALKQIPDLSRRDLLRSYGKLILNERLFQALMELPMDLRKEWLLLLN